MAGRKLSSDPEYLLSVMADLGEESGSDDDFEGWLSDEDERAVGDAQLQQTSPAPSRTLTGSLECRDTPNEYVAGDISPTHSPMQTEPTAHDIAEASPTLPLSEQNESPTPTGATSHQPTMTQATTTSPSAPDFTAIGGVIPDTNNMAPVDFFRLMFDDRVFDLILTETNRYADQYLEREKEYLESHPKARAHEWRKTELTIKEVEAFIALLIAMGLCGFPSQR